MVLPNVFSHITHKFPIFRVGHNFVQDVDVLLDIILLEHFIKIALRRDINNELWQDVHSISYLQCLGLQYSLRCCCMLLKSHFYLPQRREGNILQSPHIYPGRSELGATIRVWDIAYVHL